MRVVILVVVVALAAIVAVDAASGRRGPKPKTKVMKSSKSNLCSGDINKNLEDIIGKSTDHSSAEDMRKTNDWERKQSTPDAYKKWGILLGDKGQTEWWDVAQKVWRFGRGSFDPASGNSRKNLKCPMPKAPAVDMCKVNPGLCRGKEESFCGNPNHKKFCCQDGGCKGHAKQHVKGLPRSKMPQAVDGWVEFTNEDPDITKSPWFAHHKKIDKNFRCKVEEVELDHLTPIQDEINLGKSLTIACDVKKGKTQKFIVTEDLYIYDGHHRWSSVKACNKWLGCHIKKIKVNKCNRKAAWLIEQAHALLLPTDKDNKFSKEPGALYFEGLIELRAYYGPSVHVDEDAARETYVRHTLERMTKAGFKPHGENDLNEVWDTMIRSRAGW